MESSPMIIDNDDNDDDDDKTNGYLDGDDDNDNDNNNNGNDNNNCDDTDYHNINTDHNADGTIAERTWEIESINTFAYVIMKPFI